jgi:hypothetical protein
LKTCVAIRSECVLNGISVPRGHCRGGQMNITMVRALAKAFEPLTQDYGRVGPNGRWQTDNCVVADVVRHRPLPSVFRAVRALLDVAAVPSPALLSLKGMGDRMGQSRGRDNHKYIVETLAGGMPLLLLS